jgi:hypothetical protein
MFHSKTTFHREIPDSKEVRRLWDQINQFELFVEHSQNQKMEVLGKATCKSQNRHTDKNLSP